MPVRAVDDKPSDTLVVVPGEGLWTGSSTLPHLHQHPSAFVARLYTHPSFVMNRRLMGVRLRPRSISRITSGAPVPPHPPSCLEDRELTLATRRGSGAGPIPQCMGKVQDVELPPILVCVRFAADSPARFPQLSGGSWPSGVRG